MILTAAGVEVNHQQTGLSGLEGAVQGDPETTGADIERETGGGGGPQDLNICIEGISAGASAGAPVESLILSSGWHDGGDTFHGDLRAAPICISRANRLRSLFS